MQSIVLGQNSRKDSIAFCRRKCLAGALMNKLNNGNTGSTTIMLKPEDPPWSRRASDGPFHVLVSTVPRNRPRQEVECVGHSERIRTHGIKVHRVPALSRQSASRIIQHEPLPSSDLAQRNTRFIGTQQRPLEGVTPIDAETWAGGLDERVEELGGEKAQFLGR
jgi:hypothetical protein